MPIQKWRFIDSGNNSGPDNMALDEALLQSFDPHSSKPLLRLYGWSPPALSLGRFQQADRALDLDRCRIRGVPVVRRITGGGVIYHHDELTYGIVCAPQQMPPSDSIKESFRVLTGFLLQFYRNLGLNAAYAADSMAKGEKLGERTEFCFAGKETFDILIDGRKIGGNAQRRTRQLIFQHGSIPLTGGVEDAMQFLRIPPLGLGERVTTLFIAGVDTDSGLLKAKFKDAFCDYFGVLLIDEPPTAAELACAAQLKGEKYMNESWNLHGEGV